MSEMIVNKIQEIMKRYEIWERAGLINVNL